MEQKETLLNNHFQEFQSLVNQATPEEKTRLVAQFYSWAEQQLASLDVLSSSGVGGDKRKDRNHPKRTRAGVSRKKYRQKFSLDDLQTLIESEIHLGQIVENIEQVIWLRDIRSDRILYISPAFETIWGHSPESLYGKPQDLIESVHLEDRVQFMVAMVNQDQKPFNQTYRILRPDGSLRWIFARTFAIHDKTSEPYYQFCITERVNSSTSAAR